MARASGQSMAGDYSSGSCTRARRSSDKCLSLIRRPRMKWIAAEVRCPRPIGEHAAFTLRRRRPRERPRMCVRSLSCHTGQSSRWISFRTNTSTAASMPIFAFVRGASAFLPSEQEIMRIWGPSDIGVWLRETASRLKCHMVAKLGERGSLVCDAESGVLIHTPAHPVQVVDTTGAGDGYCGGFVAGLAAGRPLAECAAMGAVSASYVIEACGALETQRPSRRGS